MPASEKMFRLTPKLVLFSLIFFAVVSFSGMSRVLAANKNDTISFDMNLPPAMLGLGSSQVFGYLKGIQRTLNKEAEIDLKINIEKWDRTIARLETNQTDVAWLPPYYYVKARLTNKKSQIRPLVIYNAHDSTKSSFCVYSKSEAGYSTLEDLLAAKISFPDEESWVVLNHIFGSDPVMKQNQIDAYHFFGGFKTLGRESAYIALQVNVIDVTIINKLYFDYIRKFTKSGAGISAVTCGAPLPNTILVYRNNIDPRIRETLLMILTSMHRDPVFSKIHQFFKVNSGQWSPAEDADLKPWYSIYNEGVRNGWQKQLKNLPSQ